MLPRISRDCYCYYYFAYLPAEPEPMGEPEPTAEVTSLLQVVAVLAGILGFLIMIENIVVLLALTKGKPKQRRSLSCFIANIAGIFVKI